MNSGEYPLLKSPPDLRVPTVASDLEGTLTSGIVVKSIHQYLKLNQRKEDEKAIFRRYFPEYTVKKLLRLNRIGTQHDWMRALFRLFKGAGPEELRRMTDWVVENAIWRNRRARVVQELQDHLAAGRRVVITSGMPEPLLESLLAYLPGFEAVGTGILPGKDGRFSGELEAEFNVGSRKTERLKPFAGENDRIFGAYGDTIPDLPMLEMSVHPVAVHPDRKLRRHAEAAGWRIFEES